MPVKFKDIHVILIMTVLTGTFAYGQYATHKNPDSCPERFRTDSGFYYYWDIASSLWFPSRSSTAVYLRDGRRHEVTNRYWDNALQTWNPSSKQVYYYGEYYGPDKIMLSGFNNGSRQWEISARQLFSYLKTGKTDTALYQTFSGSGSWQNISRKIFGYDTLENQILYQSETWNNVDGKWIINYRFLYTYNQQLQTGFLRQSWDTSSLSWINEYRKIFSYDPSSRLTEEVLDDYDPSTGNWNHQTRITYHYEENGHMDRQLFESWYDTVWNNSADYLYYDNKLSLDTLILFRIWTGSWSDNYRYHNIYDACGNLIEESGQYPDTGTWINDYRIIRYYSPVYIPLHVEITDAADVSCYGEADGYAVAAASGGTPPYRYQWDDYGQITDSVVTTLAGNRWYSITVTDAVGDIASDSIFIAEPGPVATGPVSGDTLVSPGEIHSYEVEEHKGSVYQWHVRGGKILGENNRHEIDVVWLKPGVWTLSVTETGSAGCTGEPSSLVICSVITGIRTELQDNVNVFPNPVTGLLHITVPDLQLYSLSLHTMHGQRLHQKYNITGNTVLDLSSLSAGIYMLTIRHKERISRLKIIKY